MYKFYCDLCGRDSKEKAELTLRTSSKNIRTHYSEICLNCAKLFTDWVGQRKEAQRKQANEKL